MEKTVQNVEQEAQEKPKSEEDTQREEGSAQAEEIAKKTQYIEADRLASLKKEIEEIETRIDKKLKDFKKFVDDTEVQGRSLAGPNVAKTEGQEKTDDANKLLEGSGMSITT